MERKAKRKAEKMIGIIFLIVCAAAHFFLQFFQFGQLGQQFVFGLLRQFGGHEAQPNFADGAPQMVAEERSAETEGQNAEVRAPPVIGGE